MRLTRLSAANARSAPNNAPAAAISSPSIATSISSDRREMPSRRMAPTVSRRSSARMIINASRKAVLPRDRDERDRQMESIEHYERIAFGRPRRRADFRAPASACAHRRQIAARRPV